MVGSEKNQPEKEQISKTKYDKESTPIEIINLFLDNGSGRLRKEIRKGVNNG